MTRRLLIAGSLNMDLVVQVEPLPAPGEIVLDITSWRRAFRYRP